MTTIPTPHTLRQGSTLVAQLEYDDFVTGTFPPKQKEQRMEPQTNGAPEQPATPTPEGISTVTMPGTIGSRPVTWELKGTPEWCAKWAPRVAKYLETLEGEERQTPEAPPGGQGPKAEPTEYPADLFDQKPGVDSGKSVKPPCPDHGTRAIHRNNKDTGWYCGVLLGRDFEGKKQWCPFKKFDR